MLIKPEMKVSSPSGGNRTAELFTGSWGRKMIKSPTGKAIVKQLPVARRKQQEGVAAKTNNHNATLVLGVRHCETRANQSSNTAPGLRCTMELAGSRTVAVNELSTLR